MSIFISLLVAFALGFTGSAATEAPVQATEVQQVVEANQILEDDAEATLYDVEATREFFDGKGNTFVAMYVGSDESSDSMYNEFTYESIDFPGTFHHYIYTPLVSA